MPLPMAFWGLDSPQQLVFHNALPEGTETRDIRDDPTWVVPFMTRTTRFPMMESKHPRLARDFIWKAYKEDPEKYLLVVWCWDTYGDVPKVMLRFFRNASSATIWGMGSTEQPEWFQAEDAAFRARIPTRWDRLLEDK